MRYLCQKKISQSFQQIVLNIGSKFNQVIKGMEQGITEWSFQKSSENIIISDFVLIHDHQTHPFGLLDCILYTHPRKDGAVHVNWNNYMNFLGLQLRCSNFHSTPIFLHSIKHTTHFHLPFDLLLLILFSCFTFPSFSP